MDYFQRAKNWGLDLIFPPQCLGCGKLTQTIVPTYLCKRCLHSIPLRATSECIGCKQPSPTGATCSACQYTAAVDTLLIATKYEGLAVQAITCFKYKFVHDLHYPLSKVLRRYVGQLYNRRKYSPFHDNPIVVPVPLHPYRLRWRGFNQAELLAKEIATTFQMDLRVNTLVRKRYTAPQAMATDRKSRLEAMENVFQCTDPQTIHRKSIILIDDVCTTGATLDACARVLKNAGAQSVRAFVVARG